MQAGNAELFPTDAPLEIAPGAFVLRGFAQERAPELLTAVRTVWEVAPPRVMHTPGGQRMSAELSSCGPCGWVTDRRGYRYSNTDPVTGKPWPEMPAVLQEFAVSAAEKTGFPGFNPDACLINRYAAGARMGLHQDCDEQDFSQPIVSVSLGLPIMFRFGGPHRNAPTQRVLLEHGDVVVWGGPARLNYHGVAPLAAGEHPLTGAYRINLTFRRAQ